MSQPLSSTPRHEFRPRCALCGEAAATIQLFESNGVWRLVYEGPHSGTGPSGLGIQPKEADAIVAGFTEPYSKEKIRSADFDDDAGFCLECSRFYCPGHWNISATGGGRCPKGHFKSLDPHWSPD